MHSISGEAIAVLFAVCHKNLGSVFEPLVILKPERGGGSSDDFYLDSASKGEQESCVA